MIGQVWALARKADNLFTLHDKVERSLRGLLERINELEARVTRLEAREGQVVTEARNAATIAATTIAGGVISDAITRITRIEDRITHIEPPRQPRLNHDGRETR